MNRLTKNLTYANCCATLALFVAVSTGGAFAASQIDGRTIKRNSIPASALQNNSVTSAKIKNNQVTAADVKSGSLTPKVFNAETQKKLSGGNDQTQGGTRCSDGSSLDKCSLVDVVPTGVDQPCKFLEGGLVGVWKEPAPNFWLCTADMGNGVTVTGNPAKQGAYSGAVNA